MQKTFFQVASNINQPDFKLHLRIVALLCVLAALLGIAVLGTKAGGVAPNETPGPLSSAAPAFATSHSNGLSNGMPLP
jgi:hypothetical protein